MNGYGEVGKPGHWDKELKTNNISMIASNNSNKKYEIKLYSAPIKSQGKVKLSNGLCPSNELDGAIQSNNKMNINQGLTLFGNLVPNFKKIPFFLSSNYTPIYLMEERDKLSFTFHENLNPLWAVEIFGPNYNPMFHTPPLPLHDLRPGKYFYYPTLNPSILFVERFGEMDQQGEGIISLVHNVRLIPKLVPSEEVDHPVDAEVPLQGGVVREELGGQEEPQLGTCGWGSELFNAPEVKAAEEMAGVSSDAKISSAMQKNGDGYK